MPHKGKKSFLQKVKAEVNRAVDKVDSALDRIDGKLDRAAASLKINQALDHERREAQGSFSNQISQHSVTIIAKHASIQGLVNQMDQALQIALASIPAEQKAAKEQCETLKSSKLVAAQAHLQTVQHSREQLEIFKTSLNEDLKFLSPEHNEKRDAAVDDKLVDEIIRKGHEAHQRIRANVTAAELKAQEAARLEVAVVTLKAEIDTTLPAIMNEMQLAIAKAKTDAEAQAAVNAALEEKRLAEKRAAEQGAAANAALEEKRLAEKRAAEQDAALQCLAESHKLLEESHKALAASFKSATEAAASKSPTEHLASVSKLELETQRFKQDIDARFQALQKELEVAKLKAALAETSAAAAGQKADLAHGIADIAFKVANEKTKKEHSETDQVEKTEAEKQKAQSSAKKDKDVESVASDSEWEEVQKSEAQAPESAQVVVSFSSRGQTVARGGSGSANEQQPIASSEVVVSVAKPSA